jgi:hypothetical protein
MCDYLGPVIAQQNRTKQSLTCYQVLRTREGFEPGMNVLPSCKPPLSKGDPFEVTNSQREGNGHVGQEYHGRLARDATYETESGHPFVTEKPGSLVPEYESWHLCQVHITFLGARKRPKRWQKIKESYWVPSTWFLE